jgi:GGDEF domain-containing protein
VVADRVRTAFAEKHISASIGMAMRRPDMGLALAVDAADQSMYEEKRRKRVAGYKRSGTFG